MKFLLTITIATLAYLGAFVLLGTTIMHNDWRVFFVALLPALCVVGYAYGREEE